MSENWLSLATAAGRQGDTLLHQLRSNDNYSQLQLEATRFSASVNKLREDLVREARLSQLSHSELSRRQNLMETLTDKESQIKRLLKQPVSMNPFEDFDNTGGRFSSQPSTINDIRQQQNQVMREQDAGLESLGAIISRQKQLALDIGNEVDDQTALIDDITDRVDGTTTQMRRETRRIETVDKKSASCGYWVVIVLLLIAIVLIIFIPFNKI